VSSDPRIVAGCTFHDSWDVLPYTLEHLVGQGITDLWLIDDGSARDRSSALRRAFAGRATLRIVRKRGTAVYRERMQSLLADVARREGFDIFVPFDHDEFLDVTGDAVDVHTELTTWFNAGSGLELLVPVEHYLQHASVHSFGAEALEQCRYRVPRGLPTLRFDAKPVPGGGNQLGVHEGHKAILKLRQMPSSETLSIADENHRVMIGRELLAQPAKRSEKLVIRHLPFRSRASLNGRVQDVRRRRLQSLPAASPLRIGLLEDVDEALLDGVWAANSWSEDSEGGTSIPTSPLTSIVEDVRLVALLRAAGDRIADLHPRAVDSGFEVPDELEEFAAALLAAAVDSSVGLEVSHETVERVDVAAPAGSAAGLASASGSAEAELQRILATRSWRWTRPLRLILRSPKPLRRPVNSSGARLKMESVTPGGFRRALRWQARRTVLAVWAAYREHVPPGLRRAVPASIRLPIDRALKRLARGRAVTVAATTAAPLTGSGVPPVE
jgi:hypothetical protein